MQVRFACWRSTQRVFHAVGTSDTWNHTAFSLLPNRFEAQVSGHVTAIFEVRAMSCASRDLESAVAMASFHMRRKADGKGSPSSLGLARGYSLPRVVHVMQSRAWRALVAVATLAWGSTGCRKTTSVEPHPAPSASIGVLALPVDGSAEATAAAEVVPDAAVQPVVREEAQVVVDGRKETWRLVWRAPPKLDCVDANWWACPCNGLAFGETGVLDVVRVRPDGSEDRLELGERTVERWIPTKAETSAAMSAGLADTDQDAGVPLTRAQLQGHAVATIMKIADYDHDGRATEFVLQVAAGPCWHRDAVLVGLERTNDALHVFVDDTSDPDPGAASDHEITLEPSDWEKAKVALPRTFTRVGCGDHGATEAEFLTLSRGPKGLRAKGHTRHCP
jgi:hypothetical protein